MKKRRIPAFILSLIMILTLVPIQAFASGAMDDSGSKYEYLYYQKFDDHIEIVGCIDGAVDVVVPATIENLPVTAITSRTIGQGVSGAFEGHGTMESIDLSNTSITTIDEDTFRDCNNLNSVTLPDTLETIGKAAFRGCSNPNYPDQDQLETITLPDSLKTIGDQAFWECSFLISVNISANSELETIGANAFYLCSSLENISFPASLKTIGASAFGSCAALASVDLSNTQITEIPEGAFASAYEGSLTSVTLPDSLVTISNNAFSDCKNLTTINWPQSNNLKTVSGFVGCTALTDEAFAGMPSSVTTIGDYAFYGCSFTTVEIPENVKTIGESAFSTCESISTLTFPSGLTSIGYYSFSGCAGLAGKTIDIPATVTYIGAGAFSDIYEPFTLIIRNRDLSLEPDYSIADIEDICLFDTNNENPLMDIAFGSNQVVFKGYERTSNNTASDLFTMYERKEANEPDVDFIDLGDEPPIQTYNVSGVIPEGATLKLYRGKTAVATTSGTEPNSFTATVETGADVMIKISLEGYNDYYLTKPSADFTSDWNIGKITTGDMTPVPKNNKIAVNLKRNDEAFMSFDDIDFTLKIADTVLSEGTDYRFDYPYVVLDENINEDTIITLIATPEDSLKLSGGTATGTKESGEFAEIELVPWGNAVLTIKGDFPDSNNVLVFNSAGELCNSGFATETFTTAQLPAGTYSVVSFNKNSLFSFVSDISQLTSMGLSEGTDYVLETVSIVNATSIEKDIIVPVLDVASLSSILNDDGNSVLMRTSKVVSGETLCAYIQYSLKNAPSASAKVTVNLPEGATLVGAYDMSTNLNATLTNGSLTLDVSEQESTFYVYFTVSGTNASSVSASITDSGKTAPLGSADFTVEEFRIDTGGRWVNTYESQLVVYALPGTTVRLSLPDGTKDVYVGESGHKNVSYTIPDSALSGDKFKIVATVGELSVSETIVFVPPKAQLYDFYFIHANKRTDLIVDGTEKLGVYYNYIYALEEKDKYWTFGVTLKTDKDVVLSDSPVYVGVTMLDGSTQTVDMTRMSQTEVSDGIEYVYVGEAYLDQAGVHIFKASEIPNTFEVYYDEAYESISVDDSFNRAWWEAVDKYDAIYGNEQLAADAFDAQSLGAILSGAYIMHNEPAFADLPVDSQKKILEIEKAMKDAADLMCDSWGIPVDDIDEYLIPNTENPDDPPLLDVEKVLEHNGITFGPYSNFDPNQLESEGYTVYKIPSQRRDTAGNGVAVKTEGSKTTIVNQKDGYKMDVDYTKNSMDNTTTSLSISVYDYAGACAEEDLSTFANTLKSARGAKWARVGAKGFTVLGTALQAADIYNNIDDLGNMYADIERLRGYLTDRRMLYNRYEKLDVDPACLNALRNEIEAAAYLLHLMEAHVEQIHYSMVGGVGFMIFGVATIGGGTFLEGVALSTTSMVYDGVTNSQSMGRASEIEEAFAWFSRASAKPGKLCEDAEENARIRRALKACKATPIIDPSGFVYEALESNTLSGVTATIWYADNENGTGAIQWDASAYDQVNPQTTDDAGRFAWDVPSGYWQVRVSKDGYNDAQTEWLQVPPPRMGLAIAMTVIAAPAVESANAYEDYIEVIFNQYMDKSAVTLPDGMTGEWQGDDAYSKVLRITKDGGFTKGDEVELTISGAKNYAGTPLPAYSETLTVGARPAEIILNYESVAAMKAGTTPNVTVRVKDSDGNYMSGVTIDAVTGNTSLATIAASAVTDESGKAVLAASALLPGLTDMTFTVNGTTLSKSIDLRITVDDNKPLRPTATIGSTEFNAASPKENAITVDSGETLTISAEDGVSIFYTTDDTCPCQNSASRNVYTGPITLDATTRYRIAAYKDGMMYSDRLNINVTVNTPVEPDPDDPVEPDPVVPDPVNPSPLENRITGINAGDTYTIGQVITFTAIGAGMDNTAPNAGDTRWMPASWSVNPHGDFAAGFTQSFPSAEMKLGAHTLHVMFAEQRYDGTTWNNTGNEDEKTVDFMLLAANTPTDEPTVEPTVVPASDTSYNGTVPNTADDSMSWLWNWVLMFSVVGLCATVSMKNKEKEYII